MLDGNAVESAKPAGGRVRHRSDGGGDPLFWVEGADLTLDGTPVLRSVDLSMDPGEIVTLIGPNGAGKTSLLKLILGLQRPTAGSVRRRPGLSVGYLPQRFHVDPTLPVTVGRFLGLPNGARGSAMRGALDEVGVAYTEHRGLQSLSGGEFQRVMLARCLLRRPDLLVLDEPMQGVDVGGQVALFELIGRLRAEHGFGILMVSHDLHLVMGATDRVVCLNRHVCCAGRPEQVSASPDYRAMFGARAADALAVYAHAHDHAHDLAGEAIEAGSSAGACSRSGVPGGKPCQGEEPGGPR